MLSEEQLAQMELALRNQTMIADESRMRYAQMELDNRGEEKSMIKEQLDLSDEKKEIYYQLQGYTLQEDEQGELKWVKDPSSDLSFLTDAGINYCFWFLTGYLGKNILLGNYEDDAIMTKLEDIGVVLSDTLFTKSNKYFKEPTIEEMKEEIKNRIKKKVDIRMFARELVGKETPREEVEKAIITEMEDMLESELEKVKQKLMNERYRMVNSLVIWMLDQIHGAYQRAWKGQERRSLREHMHITENKGGFMPVQKPESFLDRFRRNSR